MQLSRCIKCRFYVLGREAGCPNCGLKGSISKRARPYADLAKVPFIFSLFFSILFLGAAAFLLSGAPVFYLLTIAFAFFAAIFLVVFRIQAKRSPSSEFKRREEPASPNSLTGKENTIFRRIEELGQRKAKIDIIISRIANEKSEKLDEIQRQLLEARLVLKSQLARYMLQGFKIKLVRIQNKLLPYLHRINSLSDFEIEGGVVSTQQTLTDIGRIIEEINSIQEDQGSAGREKHQLITSLEETAASCLKLREALLSKQALSALREVKPLEAGSGAPTMAAISHSIETFNIEAALTDFSDSFESLELEYRRFRSESEAAKAFPMEV